MPRIEIEPLSEPFKFRFYAEDELIIRMLYGDTLGVSRAVREIVRQWIIANEADLVYKANKLEGI